MIHYHGTPLTPRSEMLKMAGKHFCVSFANPADADWCLANGQSVMLDNGAFTAYKRGGELNMTAYAAWLEPRLGHPHWAVIPDQIGGDEDTQRAMITAWGREPSWLFAPVWHMGLSIDWLLELTDKWPRVCFGSSGDVWQVGSAAWERKADTAFNALAQRGNLPWVHMLRGLAMSGDKWPFASADSVNVARNFKDTGTCPERMARRIDAVQCPISWARRPEQTDMFRSTA